MESILKRKNVDLQRNEDSPEIERIHEILEGFLELLERPPRLALRVANLAILILQRFQTCANQTGRIESSFVAEKISGLLHEVVGGGTVQGEFFRSFSTLHTELLVVWEEEKRLPNGHRLDNTLKFSMKELLNSMRGRRN